MTQFELHSHRLGTLLSKIYGYKLAFYNVLFNSYFKSLPSNGRLLK